MSEKSDGRKDYIDYIKAIGILMVVYGHLYTRSLGYSYGIFQYIYAVHMPLFFIAAGLTFNDACSFKLFVKKKIKSLLVPYIQIYVLYYFFLVLLTREITPLTHFYNAIKGDINSVYPVTLWFLPCMFMTMIVYRVIAGISNTNIQHIMILICCIFSMMNSKKGPMYWSVNIVGVTMFFVHIGNLLRKNEMNMIPFLKRKGIWEFLLVISIIGCCLNVRILKEIYPYSVSIGDAVYGNPVLFILTSVAGCLSIVALSTKMKAKSLLVIGKNSFIIYALHIFVNQFFMINLEASPLYGLYQVFANSEIFVVLGNVILTGIIVMLSIGLGKYIKKIGIM